MMNTEQGTTNDEGENARLYALVNRLIDPALPFDIHHSLFDIRYSIFFVPCSMNTWVARNARAV